MQESRALREAALEFYGELQRRWLAEMPDSDA
jgi:hypothetical protein